jgi:tartrate-resistant acid phosphatase type 5
MMNSILLALLFFQISAVDTSKVIEERDPGKRVAAVERLGKTLDRSNIDLLVKMADTDPEAAVRKAVVDRLGKLNDPAAIDLLERRAASDPDAGVALLALERLRLFRAQQLGQLFEKRIALARSANDEKSLDALAAEGQRWASYARGATLPEFLQTAPPVFEAIPPRESVRVLAVSDFGTEGDEMREVAAAAAAYHRAHPIDLGLTLGDNIVPSGVTGTADRRWKGGWEDLYAPMGIQFFAVTGNHDWGYPDSPAAEILYTQTSRTWRMPALYYTYTAGPVQFFALATHAPSETQLRWLERELGRSSARWKVVYGHHPIYSHGAHGDTAGFDKTLLPVLKNRAQVYLVGHEHTMQHLTPEGGVHLFINGTGGQGIRPAKTGPRTLYSGSFYGFTVIEAGPDELKVSFVDTKGVANYVTTLK